MLHLKKALSHGKGNISFILIKKTGDFFFFLRSLNHALKFPFSFTLMHFGPLQQITKQSPISRAWKIRFLRKSLPQKDHHALAMLLFIKILDKKFWVTASFEVANLWCMVNDFFPTEARFGDLNSIGAIDTFINFFTFSNTIWDH